MSLKTRILVATAVGAAVGAWGLYHWLFGVPWRPAGVGTDYTFLWLDTGMPSDKGLWVGCSHTGDPREAQCRIYWQQGDLKLETLYRTCPASAPLARGSLLVDPQRTDIYEGVGIPVSHGPSVFSPILHLRDGAVLLPALAYGAALKKYRDSSSQPPC